MQKYNYFLNYQNFFYLFLLYIYIYYYINNLQYKIFLFLTFFNIEKSYYFLNFAEVLTTFFVLTLIMIKINDKINECLRPFIIMAICYICSIFSIRLIDILFIGGVSEISSFAGLIYGNLTSACFVSLCVFVLYLIIFTFFVLN